MINTLKSDRGLSNIIYFFREKQADVNNFHTQFISYLHVHISISNLGQLELSSETIDQHIGTLQSG